MEIFNKILHSYAIYCHKEMVKILKCYLISKKVMTLCPKVQFFLANPVRSNASLKTEIVCNFAGLLLKP